MDVRSYEIDSTIFFLNNSRNNISSCADKTVSLFSSFTNVGLFSEGSKVIQKQMNSISNSVNKMGNSIERFESNIFDKEMALKTKALGIEIPNDFVTNDSSSLVQMDSGMLSKNDGNKINASNENDEKKLEFDSSINFNKSLKNVVKEYEEKNGEILINGKKVNLGSIESNEDSSIDNSDDKSIIDKKILSSISNEINQRYSELDMALEIEKVYLPGIKVSNLTNDTFDESYVLIKKGLSSILNNGNFNLRRYNEK